MIATDRLGGKNGDILIVENGSSVMEVIFHSLSKNGYRSIRVVDGLPKLMSAVRRRIPDVILIDLEREDERRNNSVIQYLGELSVTFAVIFLRSHPTTSKLFPEIGENAATFYLRKPLDINLFITTVELAVEHSSENRSQSRKIEIKDQGIRHFINPGDIKYIKAEHVYVRFELTGGKAVKQRTTFPKLLSLLRQDRFLQTHRGYVINLERVTAFDNTAVYIGRDRIPISRKRQAMVLEALQLTSAE